MADLDAYCILGKTAKSLAVVSLINQVTGHKKIFVFGEFLALPNVQALKGTEHEPYLTLLEIFAYGTYADYTATRGLPALKPNMLHKLRMLSVVSLARQQRVVPYTLLQSMLQMDNVRAMEDLVFDTIYSGLLQGRLDQKAGLLRTQSALARDVRLSEVPAMLDTLTRWHAVIQQAQADLASGVQREREAKDMEKAAQAAFKAKVDESKRNIKSSGHGPGPNTFGPDRGGSSGLSDLYDQEGALNLDLMRRDRGARSSKRRAPGNFDSRPRNR